MYIITWAVLIYMQCASLSKDVKILLSLICVRVLSVWVLYVVAWFNVDYPIIRFNRKE
jgi:hypothetical protein